MTTPMRAPSIQQRHQVEALTKWLRNLVDIEETSDDGYDGDDILQNRHVVSSIVCIAEEMFGKQAPSVTDPASIDSYWGALFGLVTSIVPSILQQLAGRRISTLELRIILLSAMLCYCTSDECNQRRKFIGAIMQLTENDQLILKGIIESDGDLKTPIKTPSAHTATTPRSSGSRRNLDSSFASPRPRSCVALTKSTTGVDQIDPILQSDLTTLIAWLLTNPEMDHVECSRLEHLDTQEVVSAIVHVTERLCGRTLRHRVATTPDENWRALHDMIVVEIPMQIALHMPLRTRQVTVLSGLLSYAVSAACMGKTTNIGRILAMSRDIQPKLVKHIERAKVLSSEQESNSSPGSGRSRSREEAFGSPISGYTPQRKRNALGRMAVEGFFSPGTIDAALDTMVDDLRRQNDNLQQDLDVSQKRESELSSKIQDMENRLKRDMMKLESAALRKAEEARADHYAEITRLQYELEDLQDIKIKEEIAQRQLGNARDEIDLLEHTAEKLAETEEKFRKCRERMEQLGDVKDALRREEEAHSASVEECLRLENELKALQPLRRQLEDYKRRAIDAEVKLAECQEDLKHLTNISQNLTSAHKELLKGAKIHQEEAEELRKRLYEDESTAEGSASAIGEGISELNPKIKEELDRLRNENQRLQDFASKREDDAVQMLEEKLDDESRRSDKFKDQYFTTKADLELSRKELNDSIAQEDQLRIAINDWATKWTDVDKLLQEANASLNQLKMELDETEVQLKDSKEKELHLAGSLQEWQDTAGVAQGQAENHRMELEITRAKLDDTLNSLLISQEREKQLNIDLDDWASKFSALKEKQSELHELHSNARESLEETQVDLNETRAREEILREEMEGMFGEKNILEEQLEFERLSKDQAILSAKTILENTIEELEERGKKDLSDLQEKMNSLLEQERQAYRKQMIKAATDFKELMKTSTTAIEELKEEMNTQTSLKQDQYDAQILILKEEFEVEVENLKMQTTSDREGLIEKGKNMLRESKRKLEAEINEIEGELSDTSEALTQLQKVHTEYESKAQAMVAAYKHKLSYATSRITELTTENDEAQEALKTIEREKHKVLEENDRFRRQLGGRYGADGKTQHQLETLQREFNFILDENRELKKSVVKRGTGESLTAIPEDYFESSEGKPYGGGVSGATLSQLREEYEEQIQALNDEKRELVMRNSAAITDVQKAEQRSWELEKELAQIKNELTSTKLAVQRAEMYVDENRAVQQESFQDSDIKKNLPSNKEVETLIDTSSAIVDPSTLYNAILTPSNQVNVQKAVIDTGSKADTVKTVAIMSTVGIDPVVSARQMPSLIDMTQVGDSQDGQPDCQQS